MDKDANPLWEYCVQIELHYVNEDLFEKFSQDITFSGISTVFLCK